jgi:hypothetical protein
MARIATRERMAALLKQWGRSGQSAAAFCREHEIKPQRLSYWKRVFGGQPPVRRRGGRRVLARFVPVQLVGSGDVSVGCLEIHLASGERVVFPEGGSMDVLREVVALLRERC